MKGRQTIEVNRPFTLDELEQFMQQHWDKAEYNDFTVGHPTALSSSTRYIILPATEKWCTIVYPKESGLFKKEHKIVLTSTFTTSGAIKQLDRGAPRFVRYNSTTAQMQRAKNTRELGDEMRGPAEEVLQEYTAYLRSLLQRAGYLA